MRSTCSNSPTLFCDMVDVTDLESQHLLLRSGDNATWDPKPSVRSNSSIQEPSSSDNSKVYFKKQQQWLFMVFALTGINLCLSVRCNIQHYRNSSKQFRPDHPGAFGCTGRNNDKNNNNVTSLLSMFLNEAPTERNHDEKGREISSCSFQQLQEAFGVDRDNQSSNGTCWSLHEKILRIPIDKVINRNDDMNRLGFGTTGGVYKAILDIGASSTLSSFCAVALKTNHCFLPEANRNNKSQAYPCVADGPDGHLMKASGHFLPAEYTGALAWYSQLATGRVLPGLMPTWGVVVAPEDFATNSSNDPSPNHELATLVRGVILPFTNMTTTVKQFLPSRTDDDDEGALEATELDEGILMEPSKLARVFLPVTQGLAFLASLGLAHQDVHEKNLGLVAGDNGQEHAMLFDNSLVGLVENSSEIPASALNLSTSFCREKGLTIANREIAWREGLGPLGSDMTRLRYIALRLLDKSHKQAASMEDSMRHCKTAEELGRVLQKFT